MTDTPPPDDERLLNREQVAERFGITKRYLECLAHKGGGPVFIKIGRSVRYRPRDVRDWIDSRKTSSTAAAAEASQGGRRGRG